MRLPLMLVCADKLQDAYWSLSGIPNAADEAMVFTDYIYPEDFDYVMRQWDVMTANTPVSFEMRWKAPERAAPGGPDPGRWILAACFPITDAEGNVTNIFGCTTVSSNLYECWHCLTAIHLGY